MLIHIAQEETKFGLDEKVLKDILNEVAPDKNGITFKNVNIAGLMGMASFTDNMVQVRKEFGYLKSLQMKYSTGQISLPILSMGMTADYNIAIEEGSNMIRVGSLIFGERKPK